MANNASAEIPAIDAYAQFIRVLKVAGGGAGSPQTDLSSISIPWSRANSSSMGLPGEWQGFSATCWYAARDLFNGLGGPAGGVPIGAIESCVGGTAIRNWMPTKALAACPQPYNSPVPYGVGPYQHSALYNAMIAPLGTGPTSLKAIVWDQAESDSYPQTPLGYYGCATGAQIVSWRALFNNPMLPWILVHLQPYTLSGGTSPPCCLEDLRAAQLVALQQPATAVATALDLGNISSPYGAVHFTDKQSIGARIVTAALAVAYGKPSTSYAPPSFLDQAAYFVNSSTAAASSSSSAGAGVHESESGGGIATILITFDPGATGGVLALLPANSSAPTQCPAQVNAANCSDFAILGSDGGSYPAQAALSSNNTVLVLTSTAPLPPGVYGVGSSYAWAMWPLARLYGAGAAAAGADGGTRAAGPALGLPVLPWRQALTLPGPPGAPPAL